MANTLLYFSIAFILIQVALIAVPYILRRNDLLTGWTVFSVGAICFIGMSGLSLVAAPLNYVENNDADYLWFYAGVLAFFTPLTLVYFFMRWPRHFAHRRFQKWPPVTQNAFMLVVPLGIVMSLGLLFPIQVQGIGQFMGIVGRNGIIIACLFSFIFWYRQPYNPLSLVILIAVFGYSLLVSMYASSGRREMVAVLAVVPIVLYWYRYRLSNPIKTSIVILVFVVPSILIINGYSGLRHGLARGGDKSASSLVQTAMKIPGAMFDASGTVQMLGQHSVEVSLLAIHVYHTEDWDGFETEPFHAALFVAVNPMPRAFWPNKPEGLGRSLPRRTGLRGGHETWGPGIVGHGFHEGGLHILVVYGLIVGFVLSAFDTLLRLYPGNPYLLAILAANAGHIIGWTRGDIGTFSVNIIAGVIAVWLTARIVRWVCGTQIPMPFAAPPATQI